MLKPNNSLLSCTQFTNSFPTSPQKNMDERLHDNPTENQTDFISSR